MKWIIWMVGGVLAALWTGVMAMVVLAIAWTGQALQQAGSTPAASLPPAGELPGWLVGWIDPADWAAVHQAVQQTVEGVLVMLPAVGAAAGWLEVLTWTVWGVGMIALLAVAIASHRLVATRTADSVHAPARPPLSA